MCLLDFKFPLNHNQFYQITTHCNLLIVVCLVKLAESNNLAVFLLNTAGRQNTRVLSEKSYLQNQQEISIF
jgi:hypothetical protein